MKKSSAIKLTQIFAASADLRSAITCDMMQMFCVIAHANDERTGIGMKEIERLCGLNSASCSRVMQSIGTRHSQKVHPGLGLVMTEPNPGDVRAKLAFLTPKGRKFWSQLNAVMRETG